jgi:hypothetical protein
MLKKILLISHLVVIIGVLVFGAVNRTLAKNGNEGSNQAGNRRGNAAGECLAETSCDQDPAQGTNQGNGFRGGVQPGDNNPQDTNSLGYGRNQKNTTSPSQVVSGEVSAEETAAILFMREEEKLAHDVYTVFFNQWNLDIFQNIAASESSHTSAVLNLITKYGLTDPASSQAGVFNNPTLQSLYNQVVTQGSQSLVDAIQAGALIEETDILDLQNQLAQVDNPDIQRVFENLLRGSYNHLRAFVKEYNLQTGETYQPQLLSSDLYQTIIGSGQESSGYGRGNSTGGSPTEDSTRGGGYRGGRP